jgi:hypothetical protein
MSRVSARSEYLGSLTTELSIGRCRQAGSGIQLWSREQCPLFARRWNVAWHNRRNAPRIRAWDQGIGALFIRAHVRAFEKASAGAFGAARVGVSCAEMSSGFDTTGL